MKTSPQNLDILFLQIHKKIEEVAEQTAKSIIDQSPDELISYPPNGGLTEIEKNDLKNIQPSDGIKTGLRKIIANSCADVLADLFIIIDGVGDPELDYEKWEGLKLVDDSEEIEPYNDLMLHDKLYETYWEWRKRRENPGWKLDNYEE